MTNEYFNIIQPWIDQYDLIALQSGDEGDSCGREGDFAICVRELYDQGKINLADYLLLRSRYSENITKLQQPKGALNRGLTPNNWVSQSGGVIMSRDQWVPNVIACGAMNLNNSLNFLFLGHLLHRALLFTTNTCPNDEIVGQSGYSWQFPDITVLASWGLYIRAYSSWLLWLLYPLLMLFDFQTLIGSMILIHNSYFDPNNTSDVPNQLNILIQAKRRMPTIFSWLARKLLKYCSGGIQTQLDNYFSPISGSPPMNKIYEALLSEFL